MSPPIHLIGGTPQGTKLVPLLLSILVNRMASNCTNRVKYVDDATVLEFVPGSLLHIWILLFRKFTHLLPLGEWFLTVKSAKKCALVFLQYCPFPSAPLLVGSSLIENVSCYKLLGVHLSDNLTWNEHVTKKGSKRLYVIRALKKCGLTDRQLIFVYRSIIRSVLEYASTAWAGLTQYLSDHIESIQKRALKIIFPSLSYEDALKKSCLILLRQRREDACITFLTWSYSSSDLLRKLVSRVAFTVCH